VQKWSASGIFAFSRQRAKIPLRFTPLHVCTPPVSGKGVQKWSTSGIFAFSRQRAKIPLHVCTPPVSGIRSMFALLRSLERECKNGAPAEFLLFHGSGQKFRSVSLRSMFALLRCLRLPDTHAGPCVLKIMRLYPSVQPACHDCR